MSRYPAPGNRIVQNRLLSFRRGISMRFSAMFKIPSGAFVRIFLSVCLLSVLQAAHCKAAPPMSIQPGMTVSGAAVFKPGTYRLSDNGKGIVQVNGANFVVDFQGAKIEGPGKGQGI